MARRHIKRANPPRWSSEGRRLKRRRSRSVAAEPAPSVEPAVVEVQEVAEVEAAEPAPAAEAPAKRAAGRRRRRRSAKSSSSSEE